MSFEFKFPDIGEGIHEGEIVRWRVKVGDSVKEDQPLVEMETAKAIVELPSPAAGTILKLIGKEGDIINVGAPLVIIGKKDEKLETTQQQEIHIGEAVLKETSPGVVGQIPTEEKDVILPSRQEILPRIRKLANDLGINITTIKGSGHLGRITENDVREAYEFSKKPKQFGFAGDTERVPLKGVRKIIAEHMTKSKATIPHVTHMDEADASRLMSQRTDNKAEAEKRGVKLTFLPFIIKHLIEALKKHPALNAALSEDGAEIIYKKYYNIAFAVDTPEGLMLPVVKNADKKDIFELAKEITELAEKCRNRTIHLDEIKDGTFSVTNIGSIGGIFATPVITYGQTGILGLFRIKEKPMADNNRVVIKPVLTLTITFDHRVVDGAQAARFMNDLIALIENR